MQALNIISAGAAQAVVSDLAAALQRDGGPTVAASYGAVLAMKARVMAGEPADVIILTDVLLDELARCGMVVPGSRVDLGAVATGVAVRAGVPRPDVGSAETLRQALRAATSIVCPDPELATAGKVLLGCLSQLGILEEVQPQLVYCPNGYAAAARLAASLGPRDMGVMQVTEIVAHKAIALAGLLPSGGRRAAVYSAALATQSAQPARAGEFIRRLAGAGALLQAAGFVATTAKSRPAS